MKYEDYEEEFLEEEEENEEESEEENDGSSTDDDGESSDDSGDASTEDDETTDDDNEDDGEDENTSGLSDDDLSKAVTLYQALQDTSTSKSIITNLAKNAGLKLAQEIEDAPTDKKAEKVTIDSILNKHIPEKYKGLAHILKPVLEDMKAEMIDSQITKVRGQSSEQNLETAYNELTSELDDFQSLTEEMDQLSKEIRPAGEISTVAQYKKYMMRLYKLAGGKNTDTSNKNKTLSRISKQKRNAKRAGKGPSTSSDKNSGALLSLDDAIAAGMSGKSID